MSALPRAMRMPTGAVAGGWLLLLAVAAVAAPLLTPYGYDAQNLPLAFAPPSASHWLGTDEFGRDLATRLLYGARTSLSVAVAAISLSLAAGLAVGAATGMIGGAVDRAVMAVVDLTWSFPEILVALILVAILGPGTTGTLIAIAVAYLGQFTRLTRARIIALRSETYVEAARALGARPRSIVMRHLIPNALPPVLVAAMLATGDAIILEATLGFFGLGAQPPIPSWGGMMSAGAGLLFKAPGIILFPGLAIATTVIAINVAGDALIAGFEIRARTAMRQRPRT